jgi:hypothetical protein
MTPWVLEIVGGITLPRPSDAAVSIAAVERRKKDRRFRSLKLHSRVTSPSRPGKTLSRGLPFQIPGGEQSELPSKRSRAQSLDALELTIEVGIVTEADAEADIEYALIGVDE